MLAVILRGELTESKVGGKLRKEENTGKSEMRSEDREDI